MCNKTYLTMEDKFFIPGLSHYLRSYRKGFHICQLSKKKKTLVRQLQQRIIFNYRPLSRLNLDLKVMSNPIKVTSLYYVS